MGSRNRKPANARRPPQRSGMNSRPQPDSSTPAAQRAQAPSEAQTDSRNMSATTPEQEKSAPPAIVVSPGSAASPTAEPRLTYAMRAKLGVMKKESAPPPARPLSSPAASQAVASAASLVTTPPPATPPAPSPAAASPKAEIVSEEALVTPPAKPALVVLVPAEPAAAVPGTAATTPTQASVLLSPVSPAESDGDGALVSSLSLPSLSAASSRTSLMSVDDLLSPRDSYDSPPPAAVFRKFYRDRVEGDRTAASMTASETPESNMATITVSLPTPKRAHFQVPSRPPTPPVEEMQFASLNDPPAMDYSVFDQYDGATPIHCDFPDDHLRDDSFYYQPRLTFEAPTQLSRDPSPAEQQPQYAPPEHEQQQHQQQQIYAPPQHNGVYGWEMAHHHLQQQQQQWCYVPISGGPPLDMAVPPPAPYPMQAPPDQAQYHQAAQQPNGAVPPPPPPAPFVPAPAGPMRQGSFQKQQGPQQQQQPMRPPYGQQHSQGQGRPPYNRGNSSTSAGGHAYGGRQQGWGPGPNARGRGGGGGGRQFGNGGGGRGGGFGRAEREGAGGWRDGPGPMNGNGNATGTGNRREEGERGNGYDTRAPRNGRENGRNDSGPPAAQAPAQAAPPRT